MVKWHNIFHKETIVCAGFNVLQPHILLVQYNMKEVLCECSFNLYISF